MKELLWSNQCSLLNTGLKTNHRVYLEVICVPCVWHSTYGIHNFTISAWEGSTLFPSKSQLSLQLWNHFSKDLLVDWQFSSLCMFSVCDSLFYFWGNFSASYSFHRDTFGFGCHVFPICKRMLKASLFKVQWDLIEVESVYYSQYQVAEWPHPCPWPEPQLGPWNLCE